MLASFPDWQNNKNPNAKTPGYRTTLDNSFHEELAKTLASGKCIGKNRSAQTPAKPAQKNDCTVIGKCPVMAAANNGMHSAPMP
jgi:flagellar basal body rod protein FlgB